MKKEDKKLQVCQYDLIFSLGSACSCTETLRANKLQYYSYPFDWLYGNNFKGRIDIFLNDFQRYIDKDDLLQISVEELFDNPCNVYQNKHNNLVFNHEFPKNVDFDSYYHVIRKKYDRRISRLLSKIKQSHKILLVYMLSPMDEKTMITNDILEEAISKIHIKYPNKIFNILYFEFDASLQPEEYYISKIGKHINKITGNYKSIKKGDLPFKVNSAMLSTILEPVSLKVPLTNIVAYKILDIIIRCLPNRNFRQFLRKKFHIE